MFLEIYASQIQYIKVSKNRDQPLKNYKMNMEVQVNSIFPKKSIIYLKKKNGDMINGLNSI